MVSDTRLEHLALVLLADLSYRALAFFFFSFWLPFCFGDGSARWRLMLPGAPSAARARSTVIFFAGPSQERRRSPGGLGQLGQHVLHELHSAVPAQGEQQSLRGWCIRVKRRRLRFFGDQHNDIGVAPLRSSTYGLR